jgi:LPXTG-motif cell wall-anchored protein
MNFLENTEIFDWFINLYIPAIPETTVPTTEPETEENIPQTGSTGAGLAVFAVLSVAAAAAYVSKKR